MKTFTIIPLFLIALLGGCEKNPSDPAAAEKESASEQGNREKALKEEATMREKNMEDSSEFTVPDAKRKTPFDKN